MPLRQPFVHRRPQEEAGVAVDQAEVAHARMVPRFGPAISCPRILPRPSQRGKSDRLLAVGSKEMALIPRLVITGTPDNDELVAAPTRPWTGRDDDDNSIQGLD